MFLFFLQTPINQQCQNSPTPTPIKGSSKNILIRRHSHDTLLKNPRTKRNVRRRLFSDVTVKPKECIPKEEHHIFDPSVTSFMIPLLKDNQKIMQQSSSTCFRKETNAIEKTFQHMQWVKKYCNDYVNNENIKTLADLYIILQTMLKKCLTILFSMKRSSIEDEIILSYQFLKKFRTNYMIAPLKKDYLMIMKIF